MGNHEEKSKYMELYNEELEREENTGKTILEAATLMSNHAHEIIFVSDQAALSNQMRRHHSRYGQYFNRKHQRSGKVAEDRPKTCLLGSDEYAKLACFYVHANPIRGGIVKDARNYYWSTHKLFAFGIRDSWMRHVQFPSWYMNLGKTMEERRRKYRQDFARYLEEGNEITLNFQACYFFGADKWVHTQWVRVKEIISNKSPPY